VRNGSATKSPNLPSHSRVLPVPARCYRETTIHPGIVPASQESRTEQELVRDANAAIGTSAVTGVRRLPSGSIVLTFKGQEEKEKWEESPILLGVFGEGARCQLREYTVLALGVQVAAIDQANQAKAIADIYDQNPQFRG
jgi:hypothetical protein